MLKVWKCRLNRDFGDFSPRNYQSSRRRRRCRRKGIWVSLRLIWLSRFYYFLLRFPRFPRETINPLADCAENLYNPINLCEPITHPRLRLPCSFTQIDLIKQILLFPLRVLRFLRETINPLADCADVAERGCISRHLSQRAEPHENS